MGQLGRKALLSKEKVAIEKVDLGNGDFVFVKEMTGRERNNFDKILVKEIRDEKDVLIRFEQTTEDFKAKLAVNTVCDEKGVLIFEPDDYSTLSMNIGAKRLEKIVEASQKLNKVDEASKEELVKNLKADLEDNSNSGSAEN